MMGHPKTGALSPSGLVGSVSLISLLEYSDTLIEQILRQFYMNDFVKE